MKMRSYCQKYGYVKTMVALVGKQKMNELKSFRSFHRNNNYLLSSWQRVNVVNFNSMETSKSSCKGSSSSKEQYLLHAFSLPSPLLNTFSRLSPYMWWGGHQVDAY